MAARPHGQDGLSVFVTVWLKVQRALKSEQEPVQRLMEGGIVTAPWRNTALVMGNVRRIDRGNMDGRIDECIMSCALDKGSYLFPK